MAPPLTASPTEFPADPIQGALLQDAQLLCIGKPCVSRRLSFCRLRFAPVYPRAASPMQRNIQELSHSVGMQL